MSAGTSEDARGSVTCQAFSAKFTREELPPLHSKLDEYETRLAPDASSSENARADDAFESGPVRVAGVTMEHEIGGMPCVYNVCARASSGSSPISSSLSSDSASPSSSPTRPRQAASASLPPGVEVAERATEEVVVAAEPDVSACVSFDPTQPSRASGNEWLSPLMVSSACFVSHCLNTATQMLLQFVCSIFPALYSHLNLFLTLNASVYYLFSHISLRFARHLKNLFSNDATEPSAHSQPQTCVGMGRGAATTGDSQLLAFAEAEADVTPGAELASEAIDELGVCEPRISSPSAASQSRQLPRSSSDSNITCLSCVPRRAHRHRKNSRASRTPLNPAGGVSATASASSSISLEKRPALARSAPAPMADNQTTASSDSSAATASRAAGAPPYRPLERLDSGLATADSSLAPSLNQANNSNSTSSRQIASGDEPDAHQFWTRLESSGRLDDPSAGTLTSHTRYTKTVTHVTAYCCP